MLTYFETDIPVTNAFTESINRLAKDKNRVSRGYSFEVMQPRMLYTTKHKKASQTKESQFLGKATMTYDRDLSEPRRTSASIYQPSGKIKVLVDQKGSLTT